MEEVYIFGVPEERFKLLKGIPRRYPAPAPWGWKTKMAPHTVKILHDGAWISFPCQEAVLECLVCGEKKRFFYIPGSTWLEVCPECMEEFNAKAGELGFWEAVRYFRHRREGKE